MTSPLAPRADEPGTRAPTSSSAPRADEPVVVDPHEAPRPPGSARRMFCATLLALEAFVVFFAALGAYGLRVADGGVIALVGAPAALVCVVAAGLLRTGAGYVLGTAIQVALLVAGALVPEVRVHLLPVAFVFALLWGISLTLGTRIDRERAVRHEAELAHWRAQRP